MDELLKLLECGRLPDSGVPGEMGVESLEGYYGWPKYKDRGKDNLV